MNVVEINGARDPALDVYMNLTERELRNKLEPEKGVFIAESVKVIADAMKLGYAPLSFLMERRHAAGVAREVILAAGDGVPVYVSDSETLKNYTGYSVSRSVLCAMKRPPLPSAESVAQGACRVAVLEDITDATNVGAIFRSAAALGVDGVFLSPSCCDPLYRRAVRVSMGTVLRVPWTYLCESDKEWRESGMDRLRALGFTTAALALSDDAVPIYDARLAREERLALVLGTEGDGLAETTVSSCDYTVKIPMAHGVDSLNVAAAGAVAFYELCKKEKGS